MAVLKCAESPRLYFRAPVLILFLIPQSDSVRSCSPGSNTPFTSCCPKPTASSTSATRPSRLQDTHHVIKIPEEIGQPIPTDLPVHTSLLQNQPNRSLETITRDNRLFPRDERRRINPLSCYFGARPLAAPERG